MSEKENEIFVYDSFQFSEPVLMGVLYIDSQRGNESCSFEYAHSWLRQAFLDILIDPELFYYEGRQFPSGKKMFGVFCGRLPGPLGPGINEIRENELRPIGKTESQRSCISVTTCFGVYDETRMGGIRFKADPEGAFLSNDSDSAVPPWQAYAHWKKLPEDLKRVGAPVREMAESTDPPGFIAGRFQTQGRR